MSPSGSSNGSPRRQGGGRRRYILRIWVLQLGLPIALVTVGLLAFDDDLPPHTVFSVRFWLFAALIVAAVLGMAYWMGRKFWEWGVAPPEAYEE